MFVDASAWVAILADEPEASLIEERLLEADDVMVSPVVVWETVRAVAKIIQVKPVRAAELTRSYMAKMNARAVSIGALEETIALEAHARFGKGVHPAKLNMGDCFAYACARTHDAPLLYKGGDFALTDIEAA